MKRYYASLSNSKSLDELIKALEEYSNNLTSKLNLFVNKLADIGVNVALMTLATSGMGDTERDADFDIQFEVMGVTVQGHISVSSEPVITEDGRAFYPHLAWEFGVGNYYNGLRSPNPLSEKLGMGPGTFPKQHHVPNPGFWYYKDKNGDKRRSVGTQAIMPMYNATIEMISRIKEVAEEVFNG